MSELVRKIDVADPAFLNACGLGAGIEVRVDSEAGAGKFSLHRPYVLIGSDPKNDVRLDHPAVDQRHAYIQAIAGRLYCVDLGSWTGLTWGTEVRNRGWVHPEDELRVGPFRLRAWARGVPENGVVLPERGEGDPTKSTGTDGPSRSPLALHLEGRTGGPKSWNMSRQLVVMGCHRRCKVHLNVKGVSPMHAALVATPDGVWAVDLLSEVGTLVNGERVAHRRLCDGDLLGIGSIRMRVSLDPPDDPGSPTGEGVTREGGVPSQGELLAVMVEQFRHMQQQMFDQFNQNMATVLRMFGHFHQDQMDVIREELAYLKELTQEMTTLRGQLIAKEVFEMPDEEAGRDSKAFMFNGRSLDEMADFLGGTPEAEAEEERPPAPPAAGSAEPSPHPAKGEPHDAEALHSWLTDRIAKLESERRTRWGRVLRFLTGK